MSCNSERMNEGAKEEKGSPSSASFARGAAALADLCKELESENAFAGPPAKRAKAEPQLLPTTPPEEQRRKPRLAPAAKTAAKKELEKEASIAAEVEHMENMRDAAGEHPWAVRMHKRGRSDDLSPDELGRLRNEQSVAKTAGLSWEERGPAQAYAECTTGSSSSSSSGPSVPNWRGQPWREGAYGGKQRFSKRGGQHKEYYDRLNKAGLLKPTPKGAVRVTKPEDKPW